MASFLPEPVSHGSVSHGSQNQAGSTESDQCCHASGKNLKWKCCLHSSATGIEGSDLHSFPLQR